MARAGIQPVTRVERAPGKGEPIRASFLGSLRDAVAGQREALPGPERAGQPLQVEDAPLGETWFETSRETETVRVTNPEDEEQYVDVERMTRVSFAMPNGQTVTLVFSNED